MDLCPDCGANLALVGSRHRCVANKPDMANTPTEDVANTDRSSTYRYRDAEKRRAYMRDYMRERRK